MDRTARRDVNVKTALGAIQYWVTVSVLQDGMAEDVIKVSMQQAGGRGEHWEGRGEHWKGGEGSIYTRQLHVSAFSSLISFSH